MLRAAATCTLLFVSLIGCFEEAPLPEEQSEEAIAWATLPELSVEQPYVEPAEILATSDAPPPDPMEEEKENPNDVNGRRAARAAQPAPEEALPEPSAEQPVQTPPELIETPPDPEAPVLEPIPDFLPPS